MMKAIRLDKQIQCEYICQEIQSLINNHQQTSPNIDSVLVLEIKTIEHTVDDYIPKIELKP
jgi:hypothetical protein